MPLIKLVDNCVLSSFAFGQISTSMQEFGEKLDQTLNKFQPLTELQFSELFPKVWNAVNPKLLGIYQTFKI